MNHPLDGTIIDTHRSRWVFGTPIEFRSWNHSPTAWVLGPCPECGHGCTTYGGGWACAHPFCQHSVGYIVCNNGPEPDWWGSVRVYLDGGSWCATGPGFVNLQESPAGFGRTPREAVKALREAGAS